MWNTDSIWFDVSIVSTLFALGHIFFGHFEERSPRIRKFLKYVVTMTVMLAISTLAGRAYALTLLAIALIPVIVVHGILLPRKGINGWTGEPKSLYYDFRGWDKDIFKK